MGQIIQQSALQILGVFFHFGFTSKAKDAPESGDVRKALASLDDARRTALESHAEPDDPPQMEQ